MTVFTMACNPPGTIARAFHDHCHGWTNSRPPGRCECECHEEHDGKPAANPRRDDHDRS